MNEFKEQFYQDPYRKELDTTVISCDDRDGCYAVVLDETVFYPEGGGQPCDKGTINGIEVLAVKRQDQQIVHYCKCEIAVGTEVHCTIDWQYRFDLMQNHTAEHIFSGIVKRMFGYDNIGFHMGEQIHAEFNGQLTADQIQHIELEVNRAIWQNISIGEQILSPMQAADYTYRSKIEMNHMIRLVEIESYDLCACCGLHVRSTGEIGLCKVISFERHGQTTRIWMLAGERALSYINALQRENADISVMLSTPPKKISAAVKILHQNYMQLQTEHRQQVIQLLLRIVQLIPTVPAVVFEISGLDISAMRAFCNACLERDIDTVMILNHQGEQCFYVLMSRRINLKDISFELNGRIRGKGGGRVEMIQGSCDAKTDEIIAAVREITGIELYRI